MEKTNLAEFAKYYFDTSGTSLFDESTDEEKVEFMLIDPATAGTIIGATAGVIGYFSDRIDENKQQEWLESIHSELIRIKQILLDVAELIKSLKIHIDNKYIEFVNIQLAASIDSIAINNIEWRRNNDQNITDPLIKSHINSELSILQRHSRISMAYGCAHYDSIALALRTELYLMLILNRDRNGIKMMLNSYLQYFKQCLDSNYEKSLENSKQRTLNDMSSLKKSFPVGVRWSFAKFYEDYRSGRYFCRRKVRKFYTVSGSIENGFEFTEDIEHERGYCDDPRKIQSFSLVQDLKFEEESLSVDKKTQYENAHSQYKNILTPRLESLNLSMEQVKKYVTRIESLLKN